MNAAEALGGEVASSAKLERTTFEASRAAEYFDARQLSTLTGVPLLAPVG